MFGCPPRKNRSHFLFFKYFLNSENFIILDIFFPKDVNSMKCFEVQFIKRKKKILRTKLNSAVPQ